jgi:hypothetical protein
MRGGTMDSRAIGRRRARGQEPRSFIMWIRTVLSLAVALLASMATSASAQGGVVHYCQPGVSGAHLSVSGSASFAANGGSGDFVLHASNLPAGATGVFWMGSGITQAIPFGLGFRCVAGPVYRLRAVAAVPGHTSVSHALDYLDAGSASSSIAPGTAWSFQFWFRAGGSFDLTDAAQVVFGPPELVVGAASVAQGAITSHPLGWTQAGGIELVEDAAQWSALWALHDSSASPPSVDFARDVVVAVFAGMRSTSGHSITVRRVELSVARLDVGTKEMAPGRNCNVLFVATQPYHFVRVPRVEWLQLGAWTRVAYAPPCS